MQKVDVFFKEDQNIINITEKLKQIVIFCCKLVLTLEKFKYDAEISVFFTDDVTIKKLNLKYKNKNCATDVLSFPTNDSFDFFCVNNLVVLGDIVISVEKALSQFKLYFSSCFEEEIARLTVHSVLHLLGYDHENGENAAKIMKKKERIINKIVANKFKFERVC